MVFDHLRDPSARLAFRLAQFVCLIRSGVISGNDTFQRHTQADRSTLHHHFEMFDISKSAR